MSELGELIDELQFMNSFYIFIGFAIAFSLMSSFLDIPVGILHAAIPAALFFIGNGIKYIYDEYL